MPKTNRPNVIIFMMDTQGVRNMSCYGYRRPTTPNIDRLAREGALFVNHFVTAPWTLPVHASLFTGRYESGHGAGGQHEILEPGLPNMGEAFGRAGYRSVALCNNGWAYNDQGGCTGFDEHIRYGRDDVAPVAPYIPSDDPDLRDTGSLKAVGVSLKWIDEHRARRPSTPFLMFINCTEPHDPYRPPEPFRSRFLLEGVKYSPETVWCGGGQCFSTAGAVCPTLDEWFIQRSLVDGATACLDDRIGKLANELAQRGVLDDTIFIVTGDHGDITGERTHYSYHSQNGVWDWVCHTPLVIRYPKAFKAGTRCKQIVQCNDVLPALMQLCGVRDKALEASMQGENLLKALKGPIHDFALLEAQRAIHPMRRAWFECGHPEDIDVRYMNVSYKAARTKRYKYIWVSDGNDMLFDIVKDPDERWNIIKRYPEIAKKLMKAMEKKLMGIEQRYFQDAFKAGTQNWHYQMRRLAAWGFFQPGIVPPFDPKNEAEHQKNFKESLKHRPDFAPPLSMLKKIGKI